MKKFLAMASAVLLLAGSLLMPASADPAGTRDDWVTGETAGATFNPNGTITAQGNGAYLGLNKKVDLTANNLDVSWTLRLDNVSQAANADADNFCLYLSDSLGSAIPSSEAGGHVFRARFFVNNNGKAVYSEAIVDGTVCMPYGGTDTVLKNTNELTLRLTGDGTTVQLYINDQAVYYGGTPDAVKNALLQNYSGGAYLSLSLAGADTKITVLKVNGQTPLELETEEEKPAWITSDGVTVDKAAGTFSMNAVEYAIRTEKIDFTAADLDVSVALKTSFGNANQLISLYFSKDLPNGAPTGANTFHVRFCLDNGKFGLNHTWVGETAIGAYAGGYIEYSANTLYTIRFKRVDGMIRMYLNDTLIYGNAANTDKTISDFINGLGTGYLTIGTNSFNGGFVTQILQVNGETPLPKEGTPDENDPYQGEARYPTVQLSDGKLKWLGRTTASQDMVGLDWSSSGVEFNFRGAAAQMCLSASDRDDTYCTYIGVYVNGVRTQKIRLKNGNYWYNLASGLNPDTTTNIRIVKLNEASFSTADITSLALDGALENPPEKKDLILEVIGDSISAGFGVLSAPSDGFTSETEDGSYTYGALLAQKLEAELFLTAASGYGIYMNNSGKTDEPMPVLYELAQPARSKTLKWDHEKAHPNLIVINLGTNDNAAHAPVDKVQEAVKAFLNRLITLHPQAKIVWTYGLMNQDYMETLRTAVEEVRKENSQVYFVELPSQSTFSSSTGAAGHPNAETHEKTADYLYPILTKVLDGTYNPDKPDNPDNPDNPDDPDDPVNPNDPLTKEDWIVGPDQDSNEGRLTTTAVYNQDGSIKVSGGSGSKGAYIGLNEKIDLTAADLDVSWKIRLDQFPIVDEADQANIQFILSDSLTGYNPLYVDEATAFRVRIYRSYGDEFTFPEALFHNPKQAGTPGGALMAYAGRTIDLDDENAPTFTFQIKRVEGKIRFLIDGETLYTADGYDKEDRLPAKISQALEKEFAAGAYLSIACASKAGEPVSFTILEVNGGKAWEGGSGGDISDPDDPNGPDDPVKPPVTGVVVPMAFLTGLAASGAAAMFFTSRRRKNRG